MRQLESAAKFVRSFEMSNGRDVTDYYLFYATNQLLGLKKMKEAMWKADEAGDFHFSDATNPDQLVPFQKTPYLPALRSAIIDCFGTKEATVAEVEQYVVITTAFRETHFKGILKALETEGVIKPLDPRAGRKSGTFSDPNMRLRFK